MKKDGKELLKMYAAQDSQDEDIAYDDEIRAEADCIAECCACCRTMCLMT